MKNVVKYLGLLIIITTLIVNSFMLNKLIEQNTRIETKIMRLVALENANANNRNANLQIQNPQTAQKEVMTPTELEGYLGISLDKVYEIVGNKDSKIPYINIDGEYRFNRSAIDEWMKTSKEIITQK